MRSTSSLLVLTQVDRRERRGVMAALDRSQCLAWFNPDGLIVDANPNLQELLARPLDQMRRMKHADLVGEHEPELPHYQTYWRRIRDGHLRNEERSLYAADGHEVWSSISYAAIRSDGGETRRVLAIVIDLSPWSWRPKS